VHQKRRRRILSSDKRKWIDEITDEAQKTTESNKSRALEPIIRKEQVGIRAHI
jgi:hypothetical protein